MENMTVKRFLTQERIKVICSNSDYSEDAIRMWKSRDKMPEASFSTIVKLFGGAISYDDLFLINGNSKVAEEGMSI